MAGIKGDHVCAVEVPRSALGARIRTKMQLPGGYSTGHWEGDTLVVETNGFLDGQWLDRWGSPLTDKARMTERFRRVKYGTLDIALSVNDSKVCTRPWTVRLSQSIMLNSDLMDWICLENEKDFPHLVGK